MFEFMVGVVVSFVVLSVLFGRKQRPKPRTYIPEPIPDDDDDLGDDDNEEVIKVRFPHPLFASAEKVDEFLRTETRLPVLFRFRQMAGEMDVSTSFLEKIEHRIEEEIRKQRS